MRRFLFTRNAEWLACILCLTVILVVPSLCFAGDTSVGVGPIDSLSKMIVTSAKGWISPLQNYARGVFLLLAVIQLAWIGIRHSLSGDPQVGGAVGAIALEFVALGFFALLIDRGPGWAEDIVSSLQEAGRVASGAGHDVKPQQVLDEMVKLSTNVLEELSLLNAIGSGLAMAIGCLSMLFMTALIAGLMLIGWVQAWVVVGAGSILLGFGGSVWTRSLATGYLRHALGAGVKLMVLELMQSLMLGHVKAWVDAAQGGDAFSLELLTTVLVSMVIMVVMIATIPSYVSSIVTGAVMNGGEAALSRAATAAAMVGLGMGIRGAAGKSSGSKSESGAGADASGVGSTLAPGLVGAGAAPAAASSATASGSARISGASVRGQQTGAGAESSAASDTGASSSARGPGSMSSAPRASAASASVTSAPATAGRGGEQAGSRANANAEPAAAAGAARQADGKGKGSLSKESAGAARLASAASESPSRSAGEDDDGADSSKASEGDVASASPGLPSAGGSAGSAVVGGAGVSPGGASSGSSAKASPSERPAEGAAAGGRSVESSAGRDAAAPASSAGSAGAAHGSSGGMGSVLGGSGGARPASGRRDPAARPAAAVGSAGGGGGDGVAASPLPMGGLAMHRPTGRPVAKATATRMSGEPRYAGPTRLELALGEGESGDE